MGSIRIAWRASKLVRCPICNSDHSCSATDEDIHFCWRTHHDVPGWVHLGDTRNGFGYFADTGRTGSEGGPALPGAVKPVVSARQSTRKPARRLSPAELSDLLRQHLAGAAERRTMAEVLGVHPDALLRLRTGYVPEAEDEKEHWLFPERDAAGRVVGLLRRYLTGRKKQLQGSRRGLVYDPDAAPGEAVLIVEGPSDVAAAITMGLTAVGKPNNLGGADHLAELLAPHVAAGVPVLVLGENDRKADGQWPGREGAEKTAQALADAWGVPVSWALPPEGVKDLRDWMWESKPDVHDEQACAAIGRKILEEVRARAVAAAPSCGGSLHIGAKRTSVRVAPILRREEGTEPQEHIGAKRTLDPNTLADADSLPDAVKHVLASGATRRPCPRHFTPLLQSRKNPRVGLAFRADCWAFACDVCGARKRSRWLIHLMSLFDGCATLHRWSGDQGKEFEALARRFRRRKANYVAVFTSGGKAEVIASGPVPGMAPVTAPAAAGLIAAALLDLAAGARKPVATNRDWALVEQQTKGDYLRRGAAPRGGFGLVLGRLEKAGMRPAVNEISRGERCDWVFPPDWAEERVELYYDALGSPPWPGEEAGG